MALLKGMKFPLKGYDVKALEEHLAASPQARFGAPRDGGQRNHLGTDLYIKKVPDVFNIRAGRVHWVGEFYRGTWGVWVRVGPGHILGYCELDRDSIKVHVGQVILPGTILGSLGELNLPGYPKMLHLEQIKGGGHVDPIQFLRKLEARP